LAERGIRPSHSVFALKTRAGFVVSKRTFDVLDSVRLALPRSPESAAQYRRLWKICQEKKRKMSVTFSFCNHMLWWCFPMLKVR
jgi:hypothetical protein